MPTIEKPCFKKNVLKVRKAKKNIYTYILRLLKRPIKPVYWFFFNFTELKNSR